MAIVQSRRCSTSKKSIVLFLFPLLFAIIIHQAHGLTIAITGSSQGIGLDAAKRLLNAGHTVYHACRNQERADIAVIGAGGGIPLVCDLSDFTSVRAFAKTICRDAPTLDVLCLNAGIAPSTKAKVPNLTKEGYEECIGVNHLGHFLLANLMKDHLVNGGGVGRIVVTASSVHDPEGPGGAVGGEGGATLGDLSGLGAQLNSDSNSNSNNLPTMVDGSIQYNGGKVYKDSKLCNVLFCREALKRWGGGSKQQGPTPSNQIEIRSLNPGFIPSSGLFRAPRADNFFAASAFTFIAGIVGFAVPIEVGGARLAYMATTEEGEVPSGSYFSAETGSRAASRDEGFDGCGVSVEAADEGLAKRLWDRSAEIVGV